MLRLGNEQSGCPQSRSHSREDTPPRESRLRESCGSEEKHARAVHEPQKLGGHETAEGALPMSHPSVNKRQKELRKQEKQREKVAKRQDREKDKANRVLPAGSPGEDPDIAGIIPGPQPIQE